MKHFSHSHPLELSLVPEGKEVICSCCEENLAAGEEAFLCTKSKCKFSLHKPCSEFPKKLKHKCDPNHKLILHSKLPSELSYYRCDGCDYKFNAFCYHCEDCYLKVHPKCAFAPETVKREDHKHPLKLYHASPYSRDDFYHTLRCYICDGDARRSDWVYYCSQCDSGCHFLCVNAEPVEQESGEEEEEEETAASEESDGDDQEDEDDDEDEEIADKEDKDGGGQKRIRSDDENSQQHFSHHHDLNRLILDEGEELWCSGCGARNKESFHGCLTCKFYLHDTCLNTPRFLQHPYHPHHALNLFPTPTHPSRSFICNACGSAGKSFCFSCAQCDCDLHPQCAALPQELNDPDKHAHVLTLNFESPRVRNCNVCKKDVGENLWAYNCNSCNYDAHLGCVGSGLTVAVEEEREDEIGGGDQDPAAGNAVDAVNQSMNNMNAMAVANMHAMERMAQIQLQTNLARMNAHAVANMMRW